MNMPALFDLKGRVAIVTGGNGGIGRSIALGFAGAGAAVAIFGRNEEKNQQVLTELKSIGVPSLALKVRKKLLVRLREDGDSLVMPGVPQDERDMLVESQPKVFYFTDHYRDYPTVLIRLSKAKRAIVEPLLRRQWRTLASRAAVREFDAGSAS